KVRDLIQLGLDVCQCPQNLPPGFVLVFQAVLVLGMMHPVRGRVNLFYPFALHGFLKHPHHEVGFFHESIDQLGTFTWFHWCAPYGLTPRSVSNCSISSSTVRSSVRAMWAFSHKSCSCFKLCSSSVKGAPCVDC